MKTLRDKLRRLSQGASNGVWHFGTRMTLAVDPTKLLVINQQTRLSHQQVTVLRIAAKEVLNRELRFTLQNQP